MKGEGVEEKANDVPPPPPAMFSLSLTQGGEMGSSYSKGDLFKCKKEATHRLQKFILWKIIPQQRKHGYSVESVDVQKHP